MTSETAPGDRPAFGLLIPVKAWERAKTRLSTSGPPMPAGLPAAFARDVVAAAVACPLVAEVYVVTDQPDFAPAGAQVLPDEGSGDLNRALAVAADRLGRERPGSPTAVLLADVPCLRPGDLALALGWDGAERWFVADAGGTGTTLLAAAPGVGLDPRFGPDSARLHADSGAVPVTAGLASLRLDVDTAADLDRARALGTGTHTSALLRGRHG